MNQSNSEKKLQNIKLIRKLLSIIIVADQKQFITKDKLVTYTRTFAELYN